MYRSPSHTGCFGAFSCIPYRFGTSFHIKYKHILQPHFPGHMCYVRSKASVLSLLPEHREL